MKRLFSAFAWLFTTTGVVLALVAAYTLTLPKKPPQVSVQENQVAISAPETNTQQVSAGQVKGIQSVIEPEDSRSIIIANFLKRYDSPLKPYDYYGNKLVEIADRYNLDFRLLPAIAMQESNLCKLIPPDTYNCLGFGIHSKGTLGFDSYESAFERAAKEIKGNYVDEGLITPSMIMSKYTPSSNGSWADSVNQWMAEMRYNDRGRGLDNESDADVLEYTKNSPLSDLSRDK